MQLNDSQTNESRSRTPISTRRSSCSKAAPERQHLVDNDTFSNFLKCSNCYEGGVQVNSGGTVSDGATVQNSEFYGGNSDGIQNGGNGTRILNNTFHDI